MIFQFHSALKNSALKHDDAKLEAQSPSVTGRCRRTVLDHIKLLNYKLELFPCFDPPEYIFFGFQPHLFRFSAFFLHCVGNG